MGNRCGIALAVCAGLLSGCESATVPARAADDVFEFRLPVGADRVVLRWPNSSRILVFVQPGSTDQLTQLLISSVQSAALEWEAASLFGSFSFALVGTPEAADVIVSWSTATRPVFTGECLPNGGAAFTTFCLTPEGNRLQPFPLTNSTIMSHVRFLVTVRESNASDAVRIRTLVTHELGHVLGIAAHSPNPEDLMYADPPPREAPNARDRATVQLLYQTRPNITP